MKTYLGKPPRRWRVAWLVAGVLLGMTLDSVLWLTWMHRHPEQYP